MLNVRNVLCQNNFKSQDESKLKLNLLSGRDLIYFSSLFKKKSNGNQNFIFRCDSSNSKQYCFNVPYTDAKIMPGRGGKCWWIPTKKCIEQPKCETPPNPKCGQCDTWRRNDGFATCPTNTCGTYIPGMSW